MCNVEHEEEKGKFEFPGQIKYPVAKRDYFSFFFSDSKFNASKSQCFFAPFQVDSLLSSFWISQGCFT